MTDAERELALADSRVEMTSFMLLESVFCRCDDERDDGMCDCEF